MGIACDIMKKTTYGGHRMANAFTYIANGKMYLFEDGRGTELNSRVLEDYITKVKDAAKRNEWKYSGSGAAFTGTFQPGADAESRVASVYSHIHCLGHAEGDLVYSLEIDRACGIYRRFAEGDGKEGIVLSSGDAAYRDFDIQNGRMVLTSAFGGESHIGVMDLGKTAMQVYTEGDTWDSNPVWSAAHPDQIYFCSAGLPVGTEPQAKPNTAPKGYSEMVQEMYNAAARAQHGPTAICLLDIARGSMEELLANDKYDYTHPQSMPDGSLYYIRRPYRTGQKRSSPFGCLLDILLLPFRLLGALFGFLNVFSAKYSGKTLSGGRDVKNRDEQQMFIDGNLIQAEKELQANRKRGEANPGIIPHTWELRRRDANGNDTLIRAGVAAFRADKTSGEILLSNGSAILRRTPDGKESKVLDVQGVSFIC